MGSALSDPLCWDWPHWGQAEGGRKLAFPNLIKAERRPKGEAAPLVARSLHNFKQSGTGERRDRDAKSGESLGEGVCVLGGGGNSTSEGVGLAGGREGVEGKGEVGAKRRGVGREM